MSSLQTTEKNIQHNVGSVDFKYIENFTKVFEIHCQIVNVNMAVDHKSQSYILMHTDAATTIDCSKEDHIHLSEAKCELLVYGFIRRVDSNVKDMDIAYDLYQECWTHFIALCQGYKRETFETGFFYTGFECVVDTLGIQSLRVPEDQSNEIFLDFEYPIGNEESQDIHTENEHERTVIARIRWVWLTFDGDEKDYSSDDGILFKSGSDYTNRFRQQTYVTHPWKLFNKDHFLGVYVPTSKHLIHGVYLYDDPSGGDALIVKFEKKSDPNLDRIRWWRI